MMLAHVLLPASRRPQQSVADRTLSNGGQFPISIVPRELKAVRNPETIRQRAALMM
jgi:hypothetical protein